MGSSKERALNNHRSHWLSKSLSDEGQEAI